MRSRYTTAPRSRNGSTLLADIQIIGPALKRALGSSLQFTSVGAAVVAGTILACGAATGHHADGALEMFYWIYDYPTGCMGHCLLSCSWQRPVWGFSSFVRLSAPGPTPSVAPMIWWGSYSRAFPCSTGFCSGFSRLQRIRIFPR